MVYVECGRKGVSKTVMCWMMLVVRKDLRLQSVFKDFKEADSRRPMIASSLDWFTARLRRGTDLSALNIRTTQNICSIQPVY